MAELGALAVTMEPTSPPARTKAPSSDARFALLGDPELHKLASRVALKWARGDAAFAEDIRQGAFVVAMQLLLRERPPRPGHERGWMCRVTRIHALCEWRRKRDEEPTLDTDDEPDVPVEDQQTLYEEQMRVERLFAAAEDAMERYPQQAAEVLAPDGRTEKGAGGRDAATRKRRERARTLFASTLSAVMTAIVVLMLRPRTTVPDQHGLPVLSDATLATAGRELAARSCAKQQWGACLSELDHVRHLDASKFGPAEVSEWETAVAGLRGQAFAACEKSEWVVCLEGLDAAQVYDPAGDAEKMVRLARSEARQNLGVKAPPPAGDQDYSKGPGPGH
jgi:DNA-directed RNA polymerase specialized sigma24 family protein